MTSAEKALRTYIMQVENGSTEDRRQDKLALIDKLKEAIVKQPKKCEREGCDKPTLCGIGNGPLEWVCVEHFEEYMDRHTKAALQHLEEEKH